MRFSLYSKKNQLDEMQEQTLRKIEGRGFWLMWGGYADQRFFLWILGRCCHCRCFYRYPVFCIAAAVRRTDTQTAQSSGQPEG